MLYLITGANGAGKTLNALKWVREKQLAENRAVYYNGRFEMTADFGWTKIDFKDWASVPDGAIFFIDECQEDMPSGVKDTPPYIRMLAEHRRRGFDFFLITQHPQNIDLFVRRLIGSPGWHRHLKRTFGADLVSVLEWAAVNPSCEKTGAGKDASVSMVRFPKDVYGWYKSASLHTGKKSIPKQIYFLGVALLLIPTLFWLTFSKMSPKPLPAAPLAGPLAAASGASGFQGSPSYGSQNKVLTTAEFIASYQPRVDGLPMSATRYDALNMPVQAPKPAACVLGKRPGGKKTTCSCWTQQATPLAVPDDLCHQIALGGFFDDTLPVGGGGALRDALKPVAASSAYIAGVPELAPVLSPTPGYATAENDGLALRDMRRHALVSAK